MPGTYTPNHDLYKPSSGPPGETGWGDEVDQNFTTIDSTLVKAVYKPMTKEEYDMVQKRREEIGNS